MTEYYGKPTNIKVTVLYPGEYIHIHVCLCVCLLACLELSLYCLAAAAAAAAGCVSPPIWPQLGAVCKSWALSHGPLALTAGTPWAALHADQCCWQPLRAGNIKTDVIRDSVMGKCGWNHYRSQAAQRMPSQTHRNASFPCQP